MPVFHEELKNSSIMPDIAEIDNLLQMNDTVPKRILIAGMHPYVGRAFACFMHRWSDTYQTDMLEMEEDSWKESDFSGYDAVLYTGMAGSWEESDKKQIDFYKADALRAVKAAGLAKKAGIRMFVYLSSLRVHGFNTDVITKMTPVCPSDVYGRVLFNTEKALWKRRDKVFNIAILRLPMIYGYECKGQYQKIVRFAVKHGFFPEYGKKYSMIHIDNLSSAVRGVICCGKSGVYFPQDAACASLYELARAAAEFHGRKFREMKLCNPILRMFVRRLQLVGDMFFGQVCDQSLNVPEEWREVKNIRDGVWIAESGWKMEETDE